MQGNGMFQRPASLPAAPGLPQRPAFAAPPVNAEEMHQMHQGQFKGPHSPAERPLNPQHQQAQPTGSVVKPGSPTVKTSVVGEPTVDTSNEMTAKGKPGDTKAGEGADEKKSKKEKDKSMKLIYADNEVSPEEKMAKMARYAFTRPA